MSDEEIAEREEAARLAAEQAEADARANPDGGAAGSGNLNYRFVPFDGEVDNADTWIPYWALQDMLTGVACHSQFVVLDGFIPAEDGIGRMLEAILNLDPEMMELLEIRRTVIWPSDQALQIEEAERLKRTAAKSPQAKKIFATMEPVLKDFVGEIHRSIGYYKAQSKETLFSDLILLGDASKLVGLRNYLAQELQLKVGRVSLQGWRVDKRHTVDVISFTTQCPEAAVRRLLGIDEHDIPGITLRATARDFDPFNTR